MSYKAYLKIKDEVGDVDVLPVSKYHTNEDIMELYDNGIKMFGENKVQDLRVKCESLPKDISWHFIGRLQTNKVREVIKYAKLIHSVDSLKLLNVIDKESKKVDKVQDVLLQIKVVETDNKTGFVVDEVAEVVRICETLKNVCVVGFMTMAPLTDDELILKQVFESVYRLNDDYKYQYLSMGMSNDYKIAIRYGANLLRIGSKIFTGE